MNALHGIGIPPMVPPPAAPPTVTAKGAAPSFKDIMLEGIQQVNSMQHNADLAVEQLVTGEDVDPAEVMTSIQKADLSFRMMMQIRNKLLQAYQELKEIRI